jgi:hypothetical protein
MEYFLQLIDNRANVKTVNYFVNVEQRILYVVIVFLYSINCKDTLC